MPTPLLTIEGVQYKPLEDGATPRVPVVAGEVTRSFSGRLLSTVQSVQKHEWEFSLAPMLPTAAQTFRSVITGTAYVTVGGRFITDVTTTPIDAGVSVTGERYVRRAAGEYSVVLTVLIQEA